MAGQDKKTGQATVCLNMIVKDEAHVIERCLESVKPFIDTWVICDTGSSDGTQEIIQRVLKGIPGELLERPWVNFGHNRNEALEACHGRADYALVIDADEYLEAEEGASWPELTEGSYFLRKAQFDRVYWVRNLIRLDAGWRWEGVLHEYLTCDENPARADVYDMKIIALPEGARAHDPLTYRRDALVLEQALLDEPGNTRYQFYLAQSYRDADDYDLAIRHYYRRAEMGGFQEEVFYSLYQIARIMHVRGDAWESCLTAYLEAFNHTPDRIEPLFWIGVEYLHQRKDYLAWHFLSRAAEASFPHDSVLFIEDNIYEHLAAVEAGAAALRLGKLQISIELNDHVLKQEGLPEMVLEVATRNRATATERLDQRAAPNRRERRRKAARQKSATREKAFDLR